MFVSAGTHDDALYESGTFWLTVVLVVLTIGLFTAAFLPLWRDRRRLTCTTLNVRMINNQVRFAGHINLSVGGQAMTDPVVQTVTLRNEGRRDIGSASFDAGRPIRFHFGDGFTQLLEPEADLPNAALPVLIEQQTVLVGPGLLRRGETLQLVALREGMRPVTVEAPLENVRLQERTERITEFGRSDSLGRNENFAALAAGLTTLIGAVVTVLIAR